MAETNLKNILPNIAVQSSPFLSSVFLNANTHLSKIFHFNISESQSITTVKQIFHFCLHAVYLVALLFKRASLSNWQHLDLQILYRFQYDLFKKSPHAALIYFHYFCVSLVPSKQNNIKTISCSLVPSSCYATLN